MTNRIEPGEFHTLDGRFVISTRCPKDDVTDAMVALEVRRAGLALGDSVTVQCTNHTRDILLHEAQYRVTMRRDVLKQTENFRGDVNHAMEPQFAVEHIGDWWASSFVREAEREANLQKSVEGARRVKEPA